MSDAIISVSRLGKKYRLRHTAARRGERTLREVIADAARGFLPGRRPGDGQGKPAAQEDFWALKDVSFEIKQGDVVGVIGRNGAGKSTLLKVLSRITEPTEGRVHLRGRVASLLEVGTGFHQELTGRENIFLNGSILGMSRAEVKKKFDEIVAFAEVEKFLDTPVKRYSSGMYVRLAFAVAAHLEPEILIVDEVLAVGDSAFQKKCIGKMGTVASEGRTVLFVSHNLALVQSLCKQGILLAGGRLMFKGTMEETVRNYLSGATSSPARTAVSAKQHLSEYHGTTLVQVREIALVAPSTNQFAVRWREKIHLRLTLEVPEKLNNVVFGVSVATMDGVVLLGAHCTDQGLPPVSLEAGRQTLELILENPLTAGLYHISFGAHSAVSRDILFLVPEAAILEVLDLSIDERAYEPKHRILINTDVRWQVPPVLLAAEKPVPAA